MKTLKFYSIILVSMLTLKGFAQSMPDGKDESPSEAILYEENKGQVIDLDGNLHPEVKYEAPNSIPRVYLANGYMGFVFDYVDNDTTTQDTVVYIKLTLPESSSNALHAYEAGAGVSNYFLPHCAQTATGVQGFKRIVYEEVHPYIDLHFYSNQSGFKIYFVIRPGGNPNDIKLKFEGQDVQQVHSAGLHLSAVGVGLDIPNGYVYEINSQNQVSPLSWSATFSDLGNGEVGFNTQSYNTSNTLVLQFGHEAMPASHTYTKGNLGWSTYYGGQVTSSVNDLAVEKYGRAYYCGTTANRHFPTSFGAYIVDIKGAQDVYILKFDSTTQERIFATYYGGGKSELNPHITVGDSDEVHVAFETYSTNVPMSKSQPFGAWVDTIPNGPNTNKRDLVVAKFKNTGDSLLYSTYFGSGADNELYDLEMNSKGEYYLLASGALGSYYYHKAGAYSYSSGNLYYLKWNANHTINHSTHIKSPAYSKFAAMCFDANDNVFVTGKSRPGFELKNPGGLSYFESNCAAAGDAFIMQFNDNDSLIWSTYYDYGALALPTYIASDGEKIYITGRVGNNFHVKNPGGGAYIDSLNGIGPAYNFGSDMFISEFSSNREYTWGTYYGGRGAEYAQCIDVDDDGNIFVAGYATSTADHHYFPLASTAGCFHQNSNDIGFVETGFILSFNSSRVRTWATYYGGIFEDYLIRVKAYKNDYIYLGGKTVSGANSFPLETLGGTCWYDNSKPHNSQAPTSTFCARLGIDGYANFNSDPEVAHEFAVVQIYPNPTTDKLTLELDYSGTYEILDVSGKLVNSGNIKPGLNEISTNYLAIGSYILKVKTETNSVETLKFVKQ